MDIVSWASPGMVQSPSLRKWIILLSMWLKYPFIFWPQPIAFWDCFWLCSPNDSAMDSNQGSKAIQAPSLYYPAPHLVLMIKVKIFLMCVWNNASPERISQLVIWLFECSSAYLDIIYIISASVLPSLVLWSSICWVLTSCTCWNYFNTLNNKIQKDTEWKRNRLRL